MKDLCEYCIHHGSGKCKEGGGCINWKEADGRKLKKINLWKL
jgi:hypothetical protein